MKSPQREAVSASPYAGPMTDAAMIGPVEPPGLHVMTYNIRRRMAHVTQHSPDLWTRRRPHLQTLLQREMPTLLAIQEGLPDQVEFVSQALGPDYRQIGRGRNADGDGEQCAIFFHTRRLTLNDWTQRALSDSPHVAGSRSWGNMLPRIVVSADLTDVASGIRFSVLNAHFDHFSRTSRARSAKMLNDLVEATDVPAIVLGDMNAGVRSAPYRILTSGPLRDAWMAAEERLTPAWGTYSGYRRPKQGGKRIDWILVTGSVTVEAVGINAARFQGAAASDHEPVQARLTF
ncbi:endonuclease/exonuclease/phosphatase family protein [Mycetocola sp.]|uniref:endonuclease/exonuclease/phosphatase family protein n=1 Tax=Mycetocola sp. TaxID=1871042 RepID=UPI00398A186A